MSADRLNAFDETERREALRELAAGPFPAEGTNVNMHCHSFFSYNARGHSPSRIAWQARKAGLYAAGLCDFDVLDGLEEFLCAGQALGLRATVNLETRAFLREFADADINSPGEPGVTYVMGAGFARHPETGTPQAEGLAGYRTRAGERNRALVQRINGRLEEIAIDYERDVLPLTPGGAATERHIVRAYARKASQVFADRHDAASWWAPVLEIEAEATAALMADEPAFEELVRSRLAKRGGLGYEQPSEETFPPVEDFIAWVASCGAIPMTTWLDGASAGESDGRAMLECMRAKGAVAVNIIPDRNWNVSDPETSRMKRQNLDAIVRAAEDMALPVNIGTEMNKLGLPFTDDLAGAALAPYRETFLRGARIMVGHTLLHRYAAFSYISEGAAEFPDPRARNAFFEAVGGLPALTAAEAGQLEDMGPEHALAHFRRRIA